MIVKFNNEELKELLRYADGPFGEDNFESFMAEVCARTDADTGEADLDRDDYSKIALYKDQGFGDALDKVFKLPLGKAIDQFLV